MSLETELKYYCSDFEKMRSKLQMHGAEFKSCLFEENIVFDTSKRALRSEGTLLRLRRTGQNVLCLKHVLKGQDEEVKTRQEIETSVADFGQMRIILEKLGYEPALFYEKVRETWQIRECTVCLDQLPFADFVEIEGLQSKIRDCADLLGLKKKDCTTKSYHELNREYRLQKGLSLDESFVFPEPLRSKLIHKLQKDNSQPNTL